MRKPPPSDSPVPPRTPRPHRRGGGRARRRRRRRGLAPLRARGGGRVRQRRCCPHPTRDGSRPGSRRLRGAAMKIGQLVSLQGDDVLPPEFAQALSVLRVAGRADAAGAAPARARPRVRQGLGAALRALRLGARRRRLDRAGASRDARRMAATSRSRSSTPAWPARSRATSTTSRCCCASSTCCRSSSTSAGMAAEAKRQLAQEADYEAEGRFLERYARAGRRRAGAARSARALGPDDAAGHGHGFRGGRAARVARRRAAGAARRRRARCSSACCSASCSSSASCRPTPTSPTTCTSRRAGAWCCSISARRCASRAAFVANYVRITRARDRRRSRRRRAARPSAIGYAAADDSPERARGRDRHRLPRLRAAAAPRPLRLRGLRPARRACATSATTSRSGTDSCAPPPPETIFLHRKLVGTFLLLARIGARVDARALVLPFLPPR